MFTALSAALILALAGSASGILPTAGNSPASIIDPNTATSPFSGVGAIEYFNDAGQWEIRGSAGLITDRHLLTAAHLTDFGNDGGIDRATDRFRVNFNIGGDNTHQIGIQNIVLHPDWTGFSSGASFNPHDDLAIYTLAQSAPTGAAVYDLQRTPVTSGTKVTLAGYGQSVEAVPNGGFKAGTFVGADSAVKRFGFNHLDSFQADDEGSGALEVYRGDYDHPGFGNGSIGGAALAQEASTFFGDSGSLVFNDAGGTLNVVAVTGFLDPGFPTHGSTFGGNLIYPNLDFIDANIPEPATLAVLILGTLGIFARRRV